MTELNHLNLSDVLATGSYAEDTLENRRRLSTACVFSFSYV